MASTLNQPGTTDIVGLLTEQRDLCRRLNGFAESQRSLITADEPERLLALLGDRQQVLDRLTVVGEQLKPVQRNWAVMRKTLAPAQARMADDLIADVNRLLAGILQSDEQDAHLLSARKNSTAEQMRQVGRGRQAGVAYAASAKPSHVATGMDWTDQ